MFKASIESIELTRVAIGVGIVAFLIFVGYLFYKWESYHATTIHEKRIKESKK